MTTSNKRMPNGYVNKGDYGSYEPDDNYQPSPSHFGSGPKAFSVRVHVNNDTYEPGKKIWVQTSKLKNLDNFLEECRKKTNPAFGAPRRIYTPRGGRQLRFLDELTENGIYVITGNERFKRFNYKDIPERNRIPRLPTKGFKKIDINRYIELVRHPWDPRLRNKSGRCQALNEKVRGLRLRVHIIDKNEVPFKVVSVPHKDKDDIIRVTDLIAEQLRLRPIMKMYEIVDEGGKMENFKEIWRRSSHDVFDSSKESKHVPLENDKHILLLPKGEAKDLREPKVYYLDGKANFKTSPRVGQFNLYDSLSGPRTPYKHGAKLNKFSKLPSIGSNTMSPMSNVSGSHGGRAHNRHKNQRPAKQVDYDRDDGGVYRAKKAIHAQDARQERVNDNGHQRIDEYEEDSFNNTSRNASQSKPKDPPRSSTPASRGEARRKEKQQQDEAAAKIQAGFRGRKVRKEYSEKKRQAQEAKEREREMAANRRDLRDEEDEHRKKEQAASIIQASYKGHKVRKDISEKKGRK